MTWNKNHSKKQVLSTVNTLGNYFFAAATFKVCEMFLFRQSKKVCTMLWYKFFLHF